jgi:hypothetical protein
MVNFIVLACKIEGFALILNSLEHFYFLLNQWVNS